MKTRNIAISSMSKTLKTQWEQILVLGSIMMITVIIYTFPTLIIDRLFCSHQIIGSETNLLSEWRWIDYCLLFLGAAGIGLLINKERRLTACLIGFSLAFIGLCLVGLSFHQILSNGGYGLVNADELTSFLGFHVRPVVIPFAIATKVIRLSVGVLFISITYEIKSRFKGNLGIPLGVIASLISGVFLFQELIKFESIPNEAFWLGLIIISVLTITAFAAFYFLLANDDNKTVGNGIASFRDRHLWVILALLTVGILVCNVVFTNFAKSYGETGEEVLLLSSGIPYLAFFIFSPIAGYLTERRNPNPYGIPILGAVIVIIGLFLLLVIAPGERHLYLIMVLSFLMGLGFSLFTISLSVILTQIANKDCIPYIVALVFFAYMIINNTISYTTNVNKVFLICSLMLLIMTGILLYEYKATRILTKAKESSKV